MSFIIYDVETTGLNKRFDQILHFAAIRTDEHLVPFDRIEFRSRLLPNVVASPRALHITGVSHDEISDAARPSHYEMVCQIQKALGEWSPAMFLGYNSIRFDEEFLRQAFYQCLHPTFLTNTNGNARADVLNLVRAVATLRPGVLSTPQSAAGRPVFRLAELAAANGLTTQQAHDALADVELTLQMCRKVRDGASDLWSTFLRFASKAAVIDFVHEEPAFAYFNYFGGIRCIHLMTRIGLSPTDANAHYCLDLTADIEGLRRLTDIDLVCRLKTDPSPIRKLKVNGSPLLCPLWELDPEHLNYLEESDLVHLAMSVRSDVDFTDRLIRAVAVGEKLFEPSEHVELQIYGNGFSSSADVELCRQFHLLPWEQRPNLALQFSDERLKRLAWRLIYFERPDLLDDAQRCALDKAITRRIRGDGSSQSPWMTIPDALAELDALVAELAIEFHGPLHAYRHQLLARQAAISVG